MYGYKWAFLMVFTDIHIADNNISNSIVVCVFSLKIHPGLQIMLKLLTPIVFDNRALFEKYD